MPSQYVSFTIAGHNDGTFGDGQNFVDSRPKALVLIEENVHLTKREKERRGGKSEMKKEGERREREREKERERYMYMYNHHDL